MVKKVHSDAQISESAFIDELTVIGKGVILEDDVYVSSGVKIYGKATVKRGTYIGENCIIGHPQRKQLNWIVKNKKTPAEFEGEEVIIGEECTVRSGATIYSSVIIGNNCQTGHNVMIREKTKIGNDSLVGTNCIIDGAVTIGNNVSIQTGVYIPLYCKIEDNVFMGPYSKLTNDKYVMRKRYDLKGPTLEEFVSLGANCVIMPGITVKKGTVVGAGAVVTKDTNAEDIVVGVPAKLLKKIPEDWK